MQNNYFKKYLKYKKKYLSLKLQKGGKIIQTIIFKKDNKWYAELDGCEFLSMGIDNIELNNLKEYYDLCLKEVDKKKINDYINDNIDKKFVYLHNFYTLTTEIHKSLYEKKKKIIDDESIQEIKKKEEIDKIKIFEGKDLNLGDINSIAGEILLFILKSLYGEKNIILCLEPILGSETKSKSYGNMHLNDYDRYNGLINYYRKYIYTEEREVNIFDSKITFEQFNILKISDSIDSLNRILCYDRKFIIGNIDLKINNKIKILDSTCESLNIIKWGFGIENEVGIYKNITDDGIINTFNSNEIVNKIFNIKFDTGITLDELNNISLKKLVNKIIENPIVFFEGNGDYSDVMPESTNINPINMSITNYVDELISQRNNNLIATKYILNKINYYKENQLNYYNNEIYEEIKNSGEKHYDYLGSYHFNITLPHLENIKHSDSSYDKVFLNRHINFARLLQWFEPLLLAVYGQPDFRSIINKKEYSQASYRLFNSKTMFINTYNLENGFNLSGRQIKEDKIMEPITEENELHKKYQENRDKFYDYLNKSNKEFQYVSVNTDVYRNRFSGLDLRRDTGDEGGSKEFKSTYFGFEFRLMDYFPIKNLKEFCDLLWLIAFSIDNKDEVEIINASYNEIVFEQISEIVKSGWNADVKENYKKAFLEILVSLEINLDGCEIINAYSFLNCIYKKMIEKYKSINFNDLLNNNILKCYKSILEDLEIKDLDCPNREIKNKLFEYQINKLLKNNSTKKLDRLTNRKEICNTSDKFKKILNQLCHSNNIDSKEKFIEYLEENTNLQDCLITDMDDLDKDNLYNYFVYLKSEKNCKLYGDA